MLEKTKEKINQTYASYNTTENHFLNFPTSSQPDPFEKYQNHSMNQTSYQTKARNRVKGNFLERNYKISKTEDNQKMMNERELNALYYKLKYYYNDILNQNKKEIENINYIKTKINKSEKRLSDYERAKEVESGTEKISGLDTVNNVDNVINKIKDLKQHTEEAKFGVTNENEYASTLKYLMEDSKSQLMKINEEFLIIQQKLHDIKQARKILNQNINHREYARIQTHKINNFFENQIEKVNEMLVEQEYKKMAIEKKNKEKEEKLQKLKNRYNDDKKMNKYRLAQYKEETLDRISNYYYQKEKKEQKEKNIINFIVGFHFFQKYFINKNRENKNKEDELQIDMTECKKDIEFNNFMKGTKYILINSDDDEDNQSDEVLNNKNENTKRNKNNNKKKNNYIKVTFDKIKERFDELDLKYDEFYDFFTKIISKANFSRKKMRDLNEKIINLETTKNQYIQKVDEIILNDYKNLTDIINNVMKYDEIRKEKIIRFQKFIENNKKNLKNAQKLRNIKASQKITELYFEDITNPDTNKIKKQNAFIDKCKDATVKIKSYFENIKIGMIHLNNFKDFAQYYKKQLKTYNEIIPLTTGFTDKTNGISNKKYIQDLLEYAIEKKIPNSNLIYDKLFIVKKRNENMKQFLKEELTEKNFIFYLFKNFKDRIKFNTLLKKIINFYEGKSQGNLTKVTIIDKSDHNKNYKKKTTSHSNSQIDFPTYSKSNSIRSKKPSLSLLVKPNDYYFKNELPKKTSIEDIINNQYNYEKVDDSDIDEYNYHKIIRPKTTKLTTNKRIVKHLYEPSLLKGKYLRDLNLDLNTIVSNSSRKRLNSRYIEKAWNKIDNLEKQFYVYNNRGKIFYFLIIFY